MDSASNPKSLNLFLLTQRDKYIKHLIKVGVKLTKTGQFNEETFADQFFPNKDLIFEKIKEQVVNDIESSKDGGGAIHICNNSYLFDKLRKEVDDFRKDLWNIRKNTNSHNKEDLKQSTDTMETASNCGSINGKSSSNNELRTNNYARRNNANIFARSNNNFKDDSTIVNEELLPGRLSRIIVRDSNVSKVRMNVENPEFEDPIREEITIYRRKMN